MKEYEIEKLVRDALLNWYATGSCDRYGQLKPTSTSEVFGNSEEVAVEWLRNNPIHKIQQLYNHPTQCIYLGLIAHSYEKNTVFSEKLREAYYGNPERQKMNMW